MVMAMVPVMVTDLVMASTTLIEVMVLYIVGSKILTRMNGAGVGYFQIWYVCKVIELGLQTLGLRRTPLRWRRPAKAYFRQKAKRAS